MRKLVVCGVGLIGGSYALALKQASAVAEVVGLGRSAQNLQLACQLGVIDSHTSDWRGALQGADLVLLAMPVGHTEATLRELAPHLEAHTVVTDAGSTKQDVVAAARRALGDKIHQFVPGHPIAGAEQSGVAAAQASLYQGKRVVLTPLAENPAAHIDCVRRSWQACGAQVSELSARQHDEIFAAVSHLPHLLAYALVHEFASRPDAEQLFGFAASGFRDFTRIASSHPEMWRDICVANRQALLQELDAYQTALLKARVLLASADAAGLEALFTQARAARNHWLESLTAQTSKPVS